MQSAELRNLEIRKVLLLTVSNLMILMNELDKQDLVSIFKKRLSEIASPLDNSTI